MSEPEEYSDEEYNVGQAMSDTEDYCDGEYHEGDMSDWDCEDHCEEEQMSEPDHYSDEHYEGDHMSDTDHYCDEHYEEVQMSEPDHFSDDHQEEDDMADPDSYGEEQYEPEGMSEPDNQSEENFSELVAETEERVATLTAERKCLMTTIQVLEADVKCLRAVLDILEDQEPENAAETPATPNTSPTAPATVTTSPVESSLSEALSQAHNEFKNFLCLGDSDHSGECSEHDHYSDGEVSESGHTSGEDHDGIIRYRPTPIAPRVRPGRRTGVRLLIAEPQRPVADDQEQETFEEHVARLQLIEITDKGDPTGDNHPHVCSTCFTNKISYMVTPCNHVSLCGPCVKIHRRGLRSDEGVLLNYVRCPNCAQKVGGYTRVFL